MPAFYPEGDEPKLADPTGRSLHKINNLLKSIEAKTGATAQVTNVTGSSFTFTAESSPLVSAVAGRRVLTVYNEGAGVLHISPGEICTVTSYQVRLSSGDYWECPQEQISLAYSAVFVTEGAARVTEIS
jgi:hypothetical protein